MAARTLAVAILLLVLPLTAFWQVGSHDFISYDDVQYITENRELGAGLTAHGLVWAFSTTYASNWHPLTWISHLLDVQLFGLKPRGHHLMSLGLHLAGTLLLFLVLRALTGTLWRSAFVAAVFAIHPLHVESVAWAAERKDVLAAIFWMSAMGGYLRYARRPAAGSYLLTLVLFALGLMAKPTLVTLPFVLLLLDIWPLGRLNPASRNSAHQLADGSLARRAVPLVIEKAPFFALSVVSSALTYAVQEQGKSVNFMEVSNFPLRLANAFVSYARYLGKTVWPQNLVVFYPHPAEGLPVWQAVGAAALLVAITVAVILSFRKQPYLPVGWLWYVGTLVPVIGLVQVGGQAMADRYMYVPIIGLAIMTAWGGEKLLSRRGRWNFLPTVTGGLIVGTLLISARVQVSYWKDSFTLFSHAAEAMPGNWLAENNLGLAMFGRGNYTAAATHYAAAVRLWPNYVTAWSNLGLSLIQLGRDEEAIASYRTALGIDPSYAIGHYNLGLALLRRGEPEEAMAHFQEAIDRNPGFTDAHSTLGSALLRQRRFTEAAAQFSESVRLRPGSAADHFNLGLALENIGRKDEALDHYRESLRIVPRDPLVQYRLSRLLGHDGAQEKPDP